MEAVNANFDGITYAKGASVLHQLVAHVGRPQFIEGLKKYFAKHAWGNTTLDDLLVELESASGRKLDSWVNTWLQTAGVNTLRPQLEIDGDTYSSVAISQEAPIVPAGSQELRPHRLAVGLYDISGDSLVLRKSVELDVAGAKTDIAELAGEKVADLLLINDRDLSYAKLRFDDRSIATMKSHLGKLDDSLARGLIWASLWDSCRDGELSTTDYIAIALNALATESDISIVSATLAQIDTALWAYANPAKREALRLQVAAAVKSLLDSAAAGSDHQMAFARAFAGFAVTAPQLERIKAILDGAINGLVVDADIRWALFINGVKRGIFGPADIDAESAKDKTAHGKQYTAQAYAALPTVAAKEAAFQSIITDNLSNTIHAYTCRGFNDSLHNELLADFVDPYFDAILKVWESKGYEIAESTTTMLFPSWVISDETMRKAQNWLDKTGKEASHALRRAVTEGRDAMARALKARLADS